MGNVTVTVAYHNPSNLTDGMTAVNSAQETVALDSMGAVDFSVADSTGKSFNLKSGATATGYIPFSAEVGGKLPSCVANGSCRLSTWYFNTTGANAGKWLERAANMTVGQAGLTFTMVGGTVTGMATRAIIANGGLGMWNADIEKRNPACATITFTNTPYDCFNPAHTSPEPGITLTRILFNQANTPLTTSGRVTSDMPFVVLYNIVPNKDYALALQFPSGAPASCSQYSSLASPGASTAGFTANAGAAWGSTGFPRVIVSSSPLTFGSPLTLATVTDASKNPCKSSVKYTW